MMKFQHNQERGIPNLDPEEERVNEMMEKQKAVWAMPGLVDYLDTGCKITQQTAEIFAGINVDSFEDHAYGCIVGAFVADSMGSLVEFIACDVPDEKLDLVFTMPGGGPHKIGPGQITDDSEMAMCMLWGLSREEKKD